MKRLTMVSGASALGLLVAAAVMAQTTANPAQHQSGHASSVRMESKGANLTLAQFETRHERKILARDTNGDGRISRAEFLAGAKAGRGDPAAKFAKLDRNHDGVIDKSEIDASLARRFRRLDTDGNGVLTVAERAAAKHRPAKGGAAGTSPAD